MGTEQVKRRAVSPRAREKCIKRARKEVQCLDKWGYWLGIFYVVGGLTFICFGVAFVVLLQHFVQMPGNPQAQNLVWQGFTLGMVMGFIAALLMYKGGFHIIEGIDYLRGKPASRALVEYHDAIVNLMHEQDGHLSCESDTPASQESLSTREPNA